MACSMVYSKSLLMNVMKTFPIEIRGHAQMTYTVIHLLVVDVACVLFWTQSVCMVPKQNTRNIYHKQMNNGVDRTSEEDF